MAKYKIDIEIPKILDAFDKTKENINQIGNGLIENKKDTIEINKKIEQLEKEHNELKLKYNEILTLLKTQQIAQSTSPSTKQTPRVKIANQKIIGNKRTKKIHLPSCIYAAKVKKEYFVPFNNIEEATEKGFQECACILDTQ